jgi:hypothetical protein
MHRPETKIGREVKLLCSKPSMETKSMKPNASDEINNLLKPILCLPLALSVE